MGPAPAIAAGDGHVVTGRFVTRDIANLVRVTLSDGTEIRVTSTHPFLLVHRLDWITAADLLPGEQLNTHRSLCVLRKLKNWATTQLSTTLKFTGNTSIVFRKPLSSYIMSAQMNLPQGEQSVVACLASKWSSIPVLTTTLSHRAMRILGQDWLMRSDGYMALNRLAIN